MTQPQLSVRSAKARDLARQLAHKERRSIAQVVERALEQYARADHGQESAAAFYARLTRDYGVDIDLDAVIRDNRVDHSGPEF